MLRYVTQLTSLNLNGFKKHPEQSTASPDDTRFVITMSVTPGVLSNIPIKIPPY